MGKTVTSTGGRLHRLRRLGNDGNRQVLELLQNERSKTKADVEKFAIGDADDEDDDENDSDDHESNEEELTEDFFRSANAGALVQCYIRSHHACLRSGLCPRICSRAPRTEEQQGQQVRTPPLGMMEGPVAEPNPGPRQALGK